MDDNDLRMTYNEDENERKRLLRERGYEPNELSREEQDDILRDIADNDDADSERLGNVMPRDEQDGTDA